MGRHPGSHPSELTIYTGSTLTAARKNSPFGFYPDSYPSGSPLKDGDSPTMIA